MSTTKNSHIITATVKQEYRRLAAYIRSLASDISTEESEDLIQDILTAMFAVKEPQGDLSDRFTNPAAYLYKSVKNRLIKRYRDRNQQPLSLDKPLQEQNETLYDLLKDTRYEGAVELEQAEQREAVYRAIGRLNPAEQAVVIATEFENKSFKELAIEWNTPAGTLLSRKSRAIQKLRAMLAAEYNTQKSIQ